MTATSRKNGKNMKKRFKYLYRKPNVGRARRLRERLRVTVARTETDFLRASSTIAVKNGLGSTESEDSIVTAGVRRQETGRGTRGGMTMTGDALTTEDTMSGGTMIAGVMTGVTLAMIAGDEDVGSIAIDSRENFESESTGAVRI